jgi:hypothetical protein
MSGTGSTNNWDREGGGAENPIVDRYDPDLPGWTNAHGEAAHAEGWGIFDCQGSEYGRWQVQRLDDPQDHGLSIEPLESDEEAWRLIVNGTGEHHKAALEVLKEHCPEEYARVMTVDFGTVL